MRTTNAISLLTLLAALGAAQSIYDLPECATSCFATAIASSNCGLTDNYCQCTTGAHQIRQDTISCLCESTCTATDLMKAQQVSNSICSSALAASSETYSATTLGMDVCQSQPTGSSSGSGTGTAASNEASATGDSNSSASNSASASASVSVESQSGNAAAPATTGTVALQGAALGVVGLGLMAL